MNHEAYCLKVKCYWKKWRHTANNYHQVAKVC